MAPLSSLARFIIKRPRTLEPSLKQIPFVLKNVDYRTGDPCAPTTVCGGSSKHIVTFVPYKKKVYKDHDHKNMSLNRPMSPHLQIYAPSLPAMTSISQRATGVGLSLLTCLLSGITLGLPNGVDSFVEYVQKLNLPVPLIIAGKTVIAFVFTYHFFIGLRFIAFSLGKCLELKSAYSTAYMALALSGVTAVLCACIGHGFSLAEIK